jgi:hypothetical protein
MGELPQGFFSTMAGFWFFLWDGLSFCGYSEHQGSLVFGPFRFGLCKTKPQDLSDVVNHAVQCPLNVDLYLSSKILLS